MAVRNAEQDDLEEELEDEIITGKLGKREKKISGHSDGSFAGDVTHSKGKFQSCFVLATRYTL